MVDCPPLVGTLMFERKVVTADSDQQHVVIGQEPVELGLVAPRFSPGQSKPKSPSPGRCERPGVQRLEEPTAGSSCSSLATPWQHVILCVQTWNQRIQSAF